MTKKFCDFCEHELQSFERAYVVELSVLCPGATSGDIEPRKDACYHCVKSGKALAEMFAKMEQREAAKAHAPERRVG